MVNTGGIDNSFCKLWADLDAAPEVGVRPVSRQAFHSVSARLPLWPSKSSSSSSASSSELRACQAGSNSASCSFDNCSLLRLRCASSSSRSRPLILVPLRTFESTQMRPVRGELCNAGALRRLCRTSWQ